MNKITKNTFLSEILKYRNAEKILAKHNIPCLQCPFAQAEMERLKIGEICKLYNIDINKLLKDLNEGTKN